MNALISFLLLLITIVPIVILWKLTIDAHKAALRLRAAMLGATLVHECILVAFPIGYSVLTGFVLEQEMLLRATSLDLFFVMIGEGIYVSLFALGLRLKPRFLTGQTSILRPPDPRIQRLFLFFLIGIGFYIQFDQFMNPLRTLHESIEYAEGFYYSDISGMLLTWFRSFFQLTSLVACALVVISLDGQAKYLKVFRLLAGGALLFYSLTGITAGIRGRLVTAGVLLGLFAYIKNRKKALFLSVVLILLIIPVFTFMGGPFRSIFFSTAEMGGDRLDLARIFAEEVHKRLLFDSKDSVGRYSFIYKAAERAQAPRNSTVLFKLYDDGEGAGLRPLTAALYVFIPKMLWPNKRPAGSISESTFDSAVRLVRSVGYGSPFFQTGPYLASAHAYWEGGCLMIVFTGFISGMIWNILFAWYERSRKVVSIIFVVTLSAGVLANGFLTIFQPLYDIICVFWIVLLPVFLFSKALEVTLSARDKMFARYRRKRTGTDLLYKS